MSISYEEGSSYPEASKSARIKSVRALQKWQSIPWEDFVAPGFVGANSQDYALQACITNGFQEGKSARISHKRHRGEPVPSPSIPAETSGNGRASSRPAATPRSDCTARFR